MQPRLFFDGAEIAWQALEHNALRAASGAALGKAAVPGGGSRPGRWRQKCKVTLYTLAVQHRSAPPGASAQRLEDQFYDWHLISNPISIG
jgi:hypothetical protein